MNRRQFLLLIAAMMISLTTSAQRSFTVDLWPDRPRVASSHPTDSALLFVYLPAEAQATGRAVVICPGGGYSHLAIDHEGKEWAGFFNNMGIAVAVLKYRLPYGNREVPFADATEAILTLRRMAQQWHINPNDIGIMGSSAGGHLASTIATHSNADARPDFQILFYPVISMTPGITHQGSHDFLLGPDAGNDLEHAYSNEQAVSDSTPRAWIALSDDDNVVPPVNAVNYYLALQAHHVPASMLIYPSGGHGWGSRLGFKYHELMVGELRAWLNSF